MVSMGSPAGPCALCQAASRVGTPLCHSVSRVGTPLCLLLDVCVDQTSPLLPWHCRGVVRGHGDTPQPQLDVLQGTAKGSEG